MIGANPFLAILGTVIAEKLVSGAVKGVGKLIKGGGHGPSQKQLENLRLGREKMLANRKKKQQNLGNGLRLPGNGLRLPGYKGD